MKFMRMICAANDFQYACEALDSFYRFMRDPATTNTIRQIEEAIAVLTSTENMALMENTARAVQCYQFSKGINSFAFPL